MRCKKIQELLKADYLDGEAGMREGQYIKEHLLLCSQCRKLEEELQAQRKLFQGVSQQQVPEHLWQSIRDAINAERINQENRLSRRILQRLKELIWAPQPVFALASALAVIIFVLVLAGTFIQKRQSLSKANVEENIIGFSLNGENGDFLYELGTNIEEYFL